jgi:anthranilate synthase component 2
MKLLVVDNYDSFTYNLVHLFGALGAELCVLRNDDPALSDDTVEWSDAIVVGPGPGRPADAGKTLAIIAQAIRRERPLLGVCLGQQAIAEHFGGKVVHAPVLVHGKTSPIRHDGSGIFAGLASPLEATRYHSLCVTDLPSELRVVATSGDGVVQGIAHVRAEVHGVQFHPESVLTPQGHRLARNFISLASR